MRLASRPSGCGSGCAARLRDAPAACPPAPHILPPPPSPPQTQLKHSVATNAWVLDGWAFKAERLIFMNARGPGCFDFKFYVGHNPDLAALAADPLELWEHFLTLGQFQGRLHRWVKG